MSPLIAPTKPCAATPTVTSIDELPAEAAWMQRAVSEARARESGQTGFFSYYPSPTASHHLVWFGAPEVGSEAHHTLTYVPSQPLMAIATCAAAPTVTDTFSPSMMFTQAADLLARRRRATAVEPVQSRAYRSFVQLASWLGRTQGETAHILGIGRTTPLAWRRGREPQPARARRLYQTHALVSTLVRRIGEDETRRWLASGTPSPIDLIAQGDVRAADDLAGGLIFESRSSRDEPLHGWVQEPPSADPGIVVKGIKPLRRVASRVPRRRSQ